MAQINYRANLSSAIFPLSVAQAGRTVIVPGPDQNFDRRVDPEGEQKNAGIPQAIYMENVIPTVNGYQSVGYFLYESLPTGETFSAIAGYLFGKLTFHTIPIIFDGTTLYGTNNEEVTTFAAVSYSGTARIPAGSPQFRQGRGITSAVIRGKAYTLICNQSVSTAYVSSLYETEFAPTNNIAFFNVDASTSGIDFALAIEICASYNYLIILNRDGTVQWSSTTDPLDFTPSLVSGAGFSIPNETRNVVRSIESCPDGFYLYTAGGVILAKYTGNPRYPWKFIPVTDTESVVTFSTDSSNSAIVACIDLANNIRVIQESTSTLVAPEISDYLRKELQYWTYDTDTGEFTLVPRNLVAKPKIFSYLNRYLIVSCDPTDSSTYLGAFWYDMQLRRYGKLKISHTQIFAMQNDTDNLQQLYFSAGNGNITELDLTSYFSDSDDFKNVIIFGKFQYVRSRRIELHEVVVENTQHPGIGTGDLQCKILTSSNGSVFDGAVDPVLTSTSTADPYREFTCRAEGKNVAVAITGSFDLTTLELVFTPGGGR